jgi:hypothetical protein
MGSEDDFLPNLLKCTYMYAYVRAAAAKAIYSGARVSSISSRGDGLYPNILYPPLEEEGPPLFSQLSQK